MGYESKLMVVNPYRHIPTSIEGKTYVGTVATIDLCKMPYDFHRLVRDHWHDGDYYFDDGCDQKWDTDLYGDPLVATDLDTAIADLKAIDQQIFEHDGERYRRIPPAIALLEGFDQSQWDELLVIHFGH